MKNIVDGDVFTNRHGSSFVVVRYENSAKVLIRFLDKHEYEYMTCAQNVRNGRTKNPFHPSVCGVGFFGVGKYKSEVGGRLTEHYVRWVNMMKRCYDPKTHAHNPTYIGCTVDERWHNFQEFAAWYDENSRGSGESLHLDKDILEHGNRVYGPDSCELIPARINTILVHRESTDGLPCGVTLRKDTGRFSARGRGADGKHKSLGSFDCPNEAFLVYKAYKERAIKEIAISYKGIISERLFSALMNYQVKP